MCRFKSSIFIPTINNKFVSIHPMCRFKIAKRLRAGAKSKFQYILCVGSSWHKAWDDNDWTAFQYILCVGSSGAIITIDPIGREFQYILCVGSSYVPLLLSFCYLLGFNTSYVSVQVVTAVTLSAISWFQYILCVGSRYRTPKIKRVSFWFQYILCVGSRLPSKELVSSVK